MEEPVVDSYINIEDLETPLGLPVVKNNKDADIVFGFVGNTDEE